MTRQGRPFPYAKSTENRVIEQLRERPRTTDELARTTLSPEARRFIGLIKSPWNQGTTVWYIWGDERRAVRRFVEENETFIADAMETTNNVLAKRLDDSMWRLLCEEWMWTGRIDEDAHASLRSRSVDTDDPVEHLAEIKAGDRIVFNDRVEPIDVLAIDTDPADAVTRIECEGPRGANIVIRERESGVFETGDGLLVDTVEPVAGVTV